MGNLCTSMSAEEIKAAKMSKEVDAANEAAFKKVRVFSFISKVAFHR